jgi:hypothetical protein
LYEKRFVYQANLFFIPYQVKWSIFFIPFYLREGFPLNLLKRITNFITRGGSHESPAYWVYVRCSKCGEVLRTRVDLRNDLSIEYEYGSDYTYFTRKTLVGDKGCYQPIEVELRFDQRRQLIDRQIKGGEFDEEEDYNQTGSNLT